MAFSGSLAKMSSIVFSGSLLHVKASNVCFKYFARVCPIASFACATDLKSLVNSGNSLLTSFARKI
jgi:hypothetical protein